MVKLNHNELKSIKGGTWASVAVAGIQTGYGVSQMIKGKQLAKNNARPEYQIPKEISDKLSAAQMRAMNGLPAAAKQQYINNIQRSSQFGLNALSDRKAGLAGLSSLVQNQNDAYGDLMSKDASAMAANQDRLGQVQSEAAGYTDKAFELNKLQPYQEKAAAAQALTGAGTQNVFGGIKTAEGGFAQKAYMDSLLDNNKTEIPKVNIGGSNTSSLNNMNSLMDLSKEQKLLNDWKNSGMKISLSEYKRIFGK